MHTSNFPQQRTTNDQPFRVWCTYDGSATTKLHDHLFVHIFYIYIQEAACTMSSRPYVLVLQS